MPVPLRIAAVLAALLTFNIVRVAGEPAKREIEEPMPARVILVRDYGAIPDDDTCDAAAVREAVADACKEGGTDLAFEAGTYNFKKDIFRPGTRNYFIINIKDTQHVGLRGRKTAAGAPATAFEINLPLKNHIDSPGHIGILDSRHIRVSNIALDYAPRFTSAGEVLSVDRDRNKVRVRILDGMPHFDGMKCYSANGWDMRNRTLLALPAFTIGKNKAYFANTWHRAGNRSDVQYEIQNMPFVEYARPGQGISWHFSVNSGSPNLYIERSRSVTFENVHIRSAVRQACLAGFNHDLTFTKVRIAPEGNALAVGPRDGYLLANNAGSMHFDSCFIKGVRWDPINLRSSFCHVTNVVNETSLRFLMKRREVLEFPPGEGVVFWAGDRPQERRVGRPRHVGEKGGYPVYLLKCEKSLPREVREGSLFSPLAWILDDAVVENSIFESNCGTGLLVQNENVRIENNRFRHNSYAAVALGPVNGFAGGFARNVVIRGNHFSTSVWINKHGVQDGAVSTYQSVDSSLSAAPHNRNIVIENNVFSDLEFPGGGAAISIRNAQDVLIRNNRFRDCAENVRIEKKSTRNLILK